MDTPLHQLMLMAGNLQGDVRGLRDVVEGLVEQHADKADKDAKFRHHVYNELASTKAARDQIANLTGAFTNLSKKVEVATEAADLARAAHNRLDAFDNRLRPLEAHSLVRRILRNGIVQFTSALVAVAGAAAAIAQAIEGGHP